MQHPLDILERYFNYTSFKPLQEDVINAVIEGEDTFALMPTGGGKSLCYQIPALAKDGICIVISPLIALMKDQVQALTQKGIKAIALTSGLTFEDLDRILDNCIYGNYKFLYLSPERLQQELVQDRIRQMHVNLIAVDEAHCISQWGNDFRPSYKNIALLRTLQPTVNVLAVTASATPKVVDDIITELDFIDTKIFKQSFKRDNLAYMVFETEDKLYRLEQIVKKNPQSSIVYVRNRKSTIQVSQYLEQKGISATYYNGGLNNTEKDKHYQLWLNNQKQVMVATNAFGMGIDKANVKTVIHINLPESIESYFQEAGRAGRNGNKAYAVILKNNSDETIVKQQFLSTLPEVTFVKTLYRKLCNYFQISYGEGEYSTHNFNFYEFCKTYKFNSIVAYNGLQLLDKTSIIRLSREFNNRTALQFIEHNQFVFRYLERYSNIAIIVKSLLRTYGGVFDQVTKINTKKIADKANVTEQDVVNCLQQLHKDKLIELDHLNTDAQITFIEPREDDKTINRIAKTINTQNKLKHKHITSVINYVNNNEVCKNVQLLSYFGETNATNCGICSVCIKTKEQLTPNQNLNDQIIKLLQKNQMSSRELSTSLSCTDAQLKQALKQLLEQQTITITIKNTYTLL